jgi:hypothetical protein
MEMRKTVVTQFVVAIAALIGVSVAAASQLAAPAWTESKAARFVVRDAKLGLPPAEKRALEDELQRSLDVFRALEMWAIDAGDDDAFWTYHGYGNRFQTALQSVREGLTIADADCTGSGRSVGNVRFRQFTCLATSSVLSIPSAELEISSGANLPAVAEGESRELGPYLSQLRVRVTGKVSFAYE